MTVSGCCLRMRARTLDHNGLSGESPHTSVGENRVLLLLLEALSKGGGKERKLLFLNMKKGLYHSFDLG